MADLLVDTDILIDVGRGVEGAVVALSTWEMEKQIGVSAVTYMELLVGCRDKREQQAVEQFVARFENILIDADITTQAIQLLQRYRLSHGLLIADALIAATAMVKGIPLVSKNQKDYRYIEGLDFWPYPS